MTDVTQQQQQIMLKVAWLLLIEVEGKSGVGKIGYCDQLVFK